MLFCVWNIILFVGWALPVAKPNIAMFKISFVGRAMSTLPVFIILLFLSIFQLLLLKYSTYSRILLPYVSATDK